MKFGINTFLFVSPFTNRSIAVLKKVKDWGFDAVEIAIENATDIDPVKIKAEQEKAGLTCCSICGVYGPDRDLRGAEEQQQTAKDYIRKMVDYAVILGCPTIAGPHYSAVGRRGSHPVKERKSQWKTVAKNLKEVCAYAADKGVSLALEPLNRFETDFINTCEQAMQMVEDVGSPALTVHLDTFHMNIEEKDSAAAILRAGASLGHFHACGSDRGQPGNDHIDWKPIAAALKKVRYNKAVVIETFSTEVKMIAAAAAIWRAFEPSIEDIGIKGLKFLQKTLK